MPWYSEPTHEEVEAARAAVFLAETKRALRDERITDIILRLHVQFTIHNQRDYHVHATRYGRPITPPKGHYVHPVSGTPQTTARMLAMYARQAVKDQPPIPHLASLTPGPEQKP